MLEEIFNEPHFWQFDIDGTLVDSHQSHVKTANLVVEHLQDIQRNGQYTTQAIAQQLARTPVTAIVETYFSGIITAEQARELYFEKYQSLDCQPRVFPGTHKVIDYLSKKENVVAFVTAGSNFIAGHNINLIADERPEYRTIPLMCDKQSSPVKPDPQVTDSLIEQLLATNPAFDFDKRVVVGDSGSDLAYAINIEAHFIYVCGDYPNEDIQQNNTTRKQTVKDMNELYQLLANV